jgi:hypothetical protein
MGYNKSSTKKIINTQIKKKNQKRLKTYDQTQN